MVFSPCFSYHICFLKRQNLSFLRMLVVTQLILVNHLLMFIMCQDFICIISQFSQWLHEVTTITIPIFTDKGRKAQRGWITGLRSPSKEVVEPKFKLKTFWLQACILKHYSYPFCKLIFSHLRILVRGKELIFLEHWMGTSHCAWGLFPQTFSITLYVSYYYCHLPLTPKLRFRKVK